MILLPNMLALADIINFESCIFMSNCFDKNSFSIFTENLKKFQPPTHIIPDQLELVYLFVLSYN